MTEKRVMHEVRYAFSRAELLELGEELARATEELREIDRRKKQAAADIAAEQKRADGQVAVLAGRIKDRFEFRQAECIAVYGLPRAGMKQILRADNREFVCEEAMDEAEMQQGLDFGTTAEGVTETPTQ
jgi:DNA relaxase NicK